MTNSNKTPNEPSEAFPYLPPSDEIKKYAHIFKIDKPLRPRIIKLVFDKLIAAASDDLNHTYPFYFKNSIYI